MGLSAKEELREPSEVEPAFSSPPPSASQETTSASIQGGHWDCLSPCSLEAEAVSLSSAKGAACSGVCEERSSSAGSARLSLGTAPLPHLSPHHRAGARGVGQGGAGTQWL